MCRTLHDFAVATVCTPVFAPTGMTGKTDQDGVVTFDDFALLRGPPGTLCCFVQYLMHVSLFACAGLYQFAASCNDPGCNGISQTVRWLLSW